jgi:hypothetical protein
MNKAKAAKLKRAGYRITDAKGFLGLTDAEAALVELKIALVSYLRQVRTLKKVSQIELAKRIGSSQSRVAKIEAATSDVSLDLIFKALLALGEDPKKLAKAIAAVG